MVVMVSDRRGMGMGVVWVRVWACVWLGDTSDDPQAVCERCLLVVGHNHNIGEIRDTVQNRQLDSTLGGRGRYTSNSDHGLVAVRDGSDSHGRHGAWVQGEMGEDSAHAPEGGEWHRTWDGQRVVLDVVNHRQWRPTIVREEIGQCRIMDGCIDSNAVREYNAQ